MTDLSDLAVNVHKDPDRCEGCVLAGRPSPHLKVFTITYVEATADPASPTDLVLAEADPYEVCYEHLTSFFEAAGAHLMEVHVSRLDPATANPLLD